MNIFLIAINFILFGIFASADPLACTNEQMSILYQNASLKKLSVATCVPVLKPSDKLAGITFEGAKWNGMILDCKGADLGSALNIASAKINARTYSAPKNIQIRNCRVGSIQVYGMVKGVSGGTDPAEFRSSSRQDELHPLRAQSWAPSNITFDNFEIYARGISSFYLSPGVSYVTLRNSKIVADRKEDGLPYQSAHSVVYFDAESSHNTFQNNTIDVPTAYREVMAIDGSSYNKVTGNKFKRYDHGGVFIYRNCGENGVVRHSKPMFNHIINNSFESSNTVNNLPAVYVSARTLRASAGLRSECPLDRQDDGTPFSFGSSIDDRDRAIYNVVADNKVTGRSSESAYKSVESPNYIADNKTYDSIPTLSPSRCYLHIEKKWLEDKEWVERRDSKSTGCFKMICSDGSLEAQPMTCRSRIDGFDDFVIFAGQSNAVGLGNLAETPTFTRGSVIPGVSIWNTSTDRDEPYAIGINGIQRPHIRSRSVPQDFGPELSYLTRYSATAPNRQLLVLKYAKGGASLLSQDDWNPMASSQNLFDGFLGRTNAIIGSYPSLAGRLRCFVWVQGEADRRHDDNHLKTYSAAYRELVERVRLSTFSPEANVVIVRLSQRGDRLFSSETNRFRQMQAQLVTQGYRTKWVNTDDLEKIDAVHYTSEALLTLGNRIFSACQ